MARRIGNREAAALAAAEKNEALEPDRVGDGLEIAEIGFERQVFDGAIRQATAPAWLSQVETSIIAGPRPVVA
jgi:hypothetical protein